MPAPKVQYLRSAEDIDRISFQDGLAAVEVPFDLLPALPLSNDERFASPRLARLIRSIRQTGYSSTAPIICRIGMKGRWVVVDGGHRITAARKLGRPCLANLFRRRVGTLYFLLFTTEGSWRKVRAIMDTGLDTAAAGTLPPAEAGEPGTPGATPPEAGSAPGTGRS
ncbi:hypothetical protein LNKW23_27080 [Paralimibaculum aggregatum]|uniref:ParB/Sulfiredoxin domain-containing protein n=1 Tax=Paralimibaculum aggregatum TaxID=3036245 RepID=A0ABQ6LMH3_9RHOB|nr:ParB/Srx family N-terminal domain-containing protein [Limibaculum sp. NKW23]GMG83495.1 hypothetical protein LNKW23_27080 [Limibaculum sp. NKW23]